MSRDNRKIVKEKINSKFTAHFIDKFFDACYTIYRIANGGTAMNDITSAIKCTIPIGLFNRGMAGKVFDEVKKSGSKVVMKNNSPECVLMSPDEYVRLMDEVNDARLLALAVNRLENSDSEKLLSDKDVYRDLGITDDDLKGYDEVELE